MNARPIPLFFLACLILGSVALVITQTSHAEFPNARAHKGADVNGDHPSIGTVTLAELPAEAKETLALIKRGGPFPYPKDGVVFGNREKRLPPHARGYYKEYTVKTPGRRDRGPRRIVAGSRGEFYYTNDHYASFKLIKE